jgi:toxin ParE1/3/4
VTYYQFTPQAVADLFDIWTFIAEDNPAAADRVEEAVFRACDFLADSPFAGRTRKDLTAAAASLLGGAAVFELPDRVPSRT